MGRLACPSARHSRTTWNPDAQLTAYWGYLSLLTIPAAAMALSSVQALFSNRLASPALCSSVKGKYPGNALKRCRSLETHGIHDWQQFNLQDKNTNASVKAIGLFQPNPKSVPTFVSFFGQRCNAGKEFPFMATVYKQLGCNVIVGDVRGTGSNPMEKGYTTVSTMFEDSDLLMHFVTKGLADVVDPNNIIVTGWSLGSCSAMNVSTNQQFESNIKRTILLSPISDISTVTKHHVPIAYYTGISRFLIREDIDNVSKASRLKHPLLIIGGTRDPLTPFEMAEKVFQGGKSTNQTYLLEIKGGKHSRFIDMPSSGHILAEVKKFIQNGCLSQQKQICPRYSTAIQNPVPVAEVLESSLPAVAH